MRRLVGTTQPTIARGNALCRRSAAVQLLARVGWRGAIMEEAKLNHKIGRGQIVHGAVRAGSARAKGSAPRAAPVGGVTKPRDCSGCCVSASPNAALSWRKAAWYENVSPERRVHEME